MVATLTTYALNSLVNHARGVAAYTPAATHYARLYISGVEVASYTPSSWTNNATNWPNAASRIKAVAAAAAIGFVAPAAGLTFDEVRIADHATAGNALITEVYGAPVVLTDGQAWVIDLTVSTLATITGPLGALPDAPLHALLNLMFGAAANTADASVFATYFVGDPQDGGAEESATRTEIVNDGTEWDVAAAGVTRTLNDVALAAEAAATHFALYDAGAAGNLRASGVLPETPTAGTIAAGRLRYVFT